MLKYLYNLEELYMNTLIDYIKTGITLAVIAAVIFFSGKLVFGFGLLEKKHAGLFMVAAIASIVGLYFIWKFVSTIERFSTGMMLISMIIGGGVLVSSFGMSGVLYSVFFGGLCVALEQFGFYKAIYRGIGNKLGSGFAMVVKPKNSKLPKYL